MHDAGATNKVQPESWECVCLMHDALLSDLAGWDSPSSWIQLFNVNWLLGRLFHWCTGSLGNWFTGSPRSTNKVTPNSWNWVTRSNQQSRSILLEMCLLDAWRRCNQQSATRILEMCLLDAWRRCNQQSATRIYNFWKAMKPKSRIFTRAWKAMTPKGFIFTWKT